MTDYKAALEYVFGTSDDYDWDRVVREGITPPWPKREHIKNMDLPTPQARPVIYVDNNGVVQSSVSSEQVEALLGPVVDSIRATQARPEQFTEKHGIDLHSIKVGEPLTQEQWDAVTAFVREQEHIIEAYKEQARPDGGAIPTAQQWLDDRQAEATGDWRDGWNACRGYYSDKYPAPAPDVARLAEALADEWRDAGSRLRTDAMDMPPSNQKTNLLRMGRFYINRADELNAALTAARQGREATNEEFISEESKHGQE